MKVKAHEKFQEAIPAHEVISTEELDSLQHLVSGDKSANWVVNLKAIDLEKSHLAHLTQIAQTHTQSGMSFVVVVKNGDYASWEEGELVVAPSLDAAEQYVEMEEIQRQLDL